MGLYPFGALSPLGPQLPPTPKLKECQTCLKSTSKLISPILPPAFGATTVRRVGSEITLKARLTDVGPHASQGLSALCLLPGKGLPFFGQLGSELSLLYC